MCEGIGFAASASSLRQHAGKNSANLAAALSKRAALIGADPQQFLKSGKTTQRIEIAVVVEPFSISAKRERLLQAGDCFSKFTGYGECAGSVVENVRVLRIEFEGSPRPLQPTLCLSELYERNCS